MIRSGIPIWVCSVPVDMRKSFDSLAEHVRMFLGRDPLYDGMFVFRSRSGRLVKILWWDRNGLALYYKRLEKGTFQFPACDGPCMVLRPDQLLRLLEGLQPAAVSSSNAPAVSPGEAPHQRAAAV